MVSDEAEALQTDVMRFLAIICMCLMVIFSLVQSLPVSETENKPKMKNREMLKREIQVLEEKASRLKETLIALENKIALNKKHLDQSDAEIKERQKRAGKLGTITREKAKELEQKQRLLSNIDTLAKSARKKEQAFRGMAEKIQKELLAKKTDLARTAKFVAMGRKELKGIESDLNKAKNAAKPIKQTKSEISATASGEKEGFTLGFASNQVFLQLLQKQDKVAFYILSGSKSWQLKVENTGSVAFFPSPPPKRIYEMDSRTVPQKIIRAGRRMVAAFGKVSVTYGVALSPEITSRIGSLMQEKKGGDLVISSKSTVTLE